MAFKGLVLLAGLAFMQLSIADQYPCGIFDNQCGTRTVDGGNFFVSDGVILNGISGGSFLWTRDYNKDCSKQPSFTSLMNGNWYDLGVGNVPNSYRWQLYASTISVTANDNDGVNYLNGACNCGSDWKVNDPRIISDCEPGTCPDTSFLGGLPSPQTGIIPGEPAYGWYLYDSDSGLLTISQLDNDFQAAFASGPDEIATVVNQTSAEQPCSPVSSGQDYCDTWFLNCAPLLSQTVPKAMSATFQYNGDTQSSGLYTMTRTLFEDDGCFNNYMTVEENGGFEAGVTDVGDDGSQLVSRRSSYIDITPFTKDAVQQLQAECPCGDVSAWTLNTPRRLTSCLQGECNMFWYDQGTVGDAKYGLFLEQARSGDGHPELRMTAFHDDPSSVPASLNYTAYPFIASESGCKYPNDGTSNVCGLYVQDCVTSDNKYDMQQTVLIVGNAGDPTQGSGNFERSRVYFQPGTSCDQSQIAMMIDDEGYWSHFGVTGDQSQNIFVTTPKFTVEINDPNLLATYNDPNLGCPCGDGFQLNVPRELTSCPMESCPRPDIFGTGQLQVPAYTNVRSTNTSLRMIPFQQDRSGFEQQFSIDDFPIPTREGCLPPEPVSELEGDYLQICRPDPEAPKGQTLEVSGTMYYNGNYFNSTRVKYAENNGCYQNPVLEIITYGQLHSLGESEVVEDAQVLEMVVDSMIVTPHTSDMVSYLNNACPCNSKNAVWKQDEPYEFSDCDTSQCPDFAAFRQPPNKKVYGVATKSTSYLVLSKFLADKTQGSSQVVSSNDLSWVLITNVPEPSSGRMSGGVIFLLIVLVVVLSYIMIGMAWNFKQTGTADFPNGEFWESVRANISAGFLFTFVDCCGFSSTSSINSFAPLQETTTEEPRTYGTSD